MSYDARLPTNSRPHEEGQAIFLQFHDLRKVGAESFTDQSTGLMKNLIQIIRAQSQFPELS